MTVHWKKLLRWDVLALVAFALYPPVCALLGSMTGQGATFGNSLGDKLSTIFVFAVLALGLNVAVGYTGLLQLGIAAFFGIGAYIAGILTVTTYPFQVGFTVALVMATLGAALFGLILGAPTLRLRGDYLAIVTLGFGEMTMVTLRNLEEITGGTKGLNPLQQPQLPAWLADGLARLGIADDWQLDYRLFFYLTLVLLAVVVVALRNLEGSRLGRAWIALREDELAANCMGISAPRVKLAAFAMSAALAGMAGCLYAAKLNGTSEPTNTYNFNRSIIMLCCVIVGGLGSLRGTLLGVLLLMGFDNILSPEFDSWIQKSGVRESATAWARSLAPDDRTFPQLMSRILTFSNWRLMIFGLALVLVMRFRPEGLLPSLRIQHELHQEEQQTTEG